MIVWLDHLIFGNGYGLASPYFNTVLYWLVDKSHPKKKGQLYTWSGGLGAQLNSFQWLHPKPGEYRIICGREYRPFNSTRRWIRVQVSWATPIGTTIDEHHYHLRKIKEDLCRGSGYF